MSFPSHFLDQIRSNVLISEVIGRAVTLKRAGREFSACCPFHNEKSQALPSMIKKLSIIVLAVGRMGTLLNF